MMCRYLGSLILLPQDANVPAGLRLGFSGTNPCSARSLVSSDADHSLLLILWRGDLSRRNPRTTSHVSLLIAVRAESACLCLVKSWTLFHAKHGEVCSSPFSSVSVFPCDRATEYRYQPQP